MLARKALRIVKGAANILLGKAHIGMCPVCENKTVFIPFGNWYREDLKCLRCRSSTRHRAIAYYVKTTIRNLETKKAYEPAPDGKTGRFFANWFLHYQHSHYFENDACKKYQKPYRNENLESLSFNDSSFDIIITQDVFEHIADPIRAFQEIERVLKPGGSHVFTIPWYPDKKTRKRATIKEGNITHLAIPEFHGNPVDRSGSLVFNDFGGDLFALIETATGMKTSAVQLQNCKFGIMGDSINVFHSIKQPKPTPETKF